MMDVDDTYCWKTDRENGGKKHSFLLPSSLRCIITGKSGVGKTSLLLHMLLEPDILQYDTLTVCGASLHQKEYKVLEHSLAKGLSKSQIKVLFQRQREVEEEGGIQNVLNSYDGLCRGGITGNFFTDIPKIPDPSSYDPTKNNLLVLDDVMLGPQNRAEAMFTRGRHNGLHCIYITQSYFRLPRQSLRENSSLFIFFMQDKKNLIHIFNDHCACDDLTFDRFVNFCNTVWRECKHNFVTLDVTRHQNLGKYRKNLSHYWIPKYDMLMEQLEEN